MMWAVNSHLHRKNWSHINGATKFMEEPGADGTPGSRHIVQLLNSIASLPPSFMCARESLQLNDASQLSKQVFHGSSWWSVKWFWYKQQSCDVHNVRKIWWCTMNPMNAKRNCKLWYRHSKDASQPWRFGFRIGDRGWNNFLYSPSWWIAKKKCTMVIQAAIFLIKIKVGYKMLGSILTMCGAMIMNSILTMHQTLCFKLHGKM